MFDRTFLREGLKDVRAEVDFLPALRSTCGRTVRPIRK
jgi:hypothetical protein